jgi:hypothetical protein
MLADVDAFLAQRPVPARRGGHWYSLRKFVRRNRLSLALATALGFAVAAGGWVWHTARARGGEIRAAAQTATSPAQAVAPVVESAVKQTATAPGPLSPAPPARDQVDIQLLLAYVKFNAGECLGIDEPLVKAAAMIPRMPAGRDREIARMRYALLRGLCDARAGGTAQAADLVLEGLRLRDRLGPVDQFRPIFASRLASLARSYIEKGEVVRGAEMMRWAAVEAQRVKRPNESLQIWGTLLAVLGRSPEGLALMPEYCKLAPQAAAARCSSPSGGGGDTESAEQQLARSPDSVPALARALTAHQELAALLQSQGRTVLARRHQRRRLEILDRLIELEPGSERWRAMRERGQNRFRKGGGAGR